MIPDVYPKTHGRIIGAFVAGGYAVSPALADDIDVFVTVVPSAHPGNLERVKQDILAYLNDQYGLDTVAEILDATVNHERQDTYETIFETLKVARVLLAGITYHVMVTTGNIGDVLNSFDLSICQVAIDELGAVHKGIDYTTPFEPIVVLKDTPTTYQRMVKYMTRFQTEGEGFYIMKHDKVAQSLADLKPVPFAQCGAMFRQGERAYDCGHEAGHAGNHDSYRAQEDRTEASVEISQ